MRTYISRRRFALITGTAGITPLAVVGAEPLTAEAVVRRLQAELGGDWPATGLDGLRAGELVASEGAVFLSNMLVIGQTGG